ncbi:MAG: DUF1893 domain-containing protein [Solobacterium sp.]|nr:DUF1893 domain-containing protein [Solobacterium sp.]MBQ1446790.1 DUF1893 domain-containing protein [Solobacterium sp.]
MMNIDVCREILHNEQLTCVIADENEVLLRRSGKGILPMLEVLDLYEEQNCRPLYQADKIIGKAAIIIAAHCGIREIYTDVISRTALEIARRKGIRIEYGQMVEMILNPSKQVEGPFEAALHNIDEDDFGLVLDTIHATLDRMGIKYR